MQGCPKVSKCAAGARWMQVVVLEGHHGFVKGVAWDPFNMYLATQVG